eukprot:4735173-Pleurochrysis_carterae.AAC.1
MAPTSVRVKSERCNSKASAYEITSMFNGISNSLRRLADEETVPARDRRVPQQAFASHRIACVRSRS